MRILRLSILAVPAAVALFVLSTNSIYAKTPVRMAYLQNDLHHLALWVGMEKGFYADENIDIDIVGTFRAGPELMSAFIAGELDVAFLGEAPATIAVARGNARVKAIAQANTEGSALVISEAVKGGKLENPTIAMPGHGTVQDLLLRKALALSNLGLDDRQVNIIVLRPPEMISAFERGEIDGFIAWEPFPSRAMVNGSGVVRIASRDIWSGHPCCILAADTAFMKKQQQAVDGLIRAHNRATAYIHDNMDECIAIAVKYTGMDKQVIRSALDQVTYIDELSSAGEEEYVSFLNRLKVIDVKDIDAFTKAFIAEEIQKKALR